jgi:hypothetical protein
MKRLDNKELSKKLVDNFSNKFHNSIKLVKNHSSKKCLAKGNLIDGFSLNKEGVKYFEKINKPTVHSLGYKL